jgi:dipeptidase D
MTLALIEDQSIKHGPLEVLFTSNEEDGMFGMLGFDVNKLKCKYMINLDSEIDNEISIGCPGNIDIEISLSFKRESAKLPNTTNLKLIAHGGLGGHSGMMIAQKRINAIKQIFDTLTLISEKHEVRLINVEKTGVAKNVIPFECSVEICVNSNDVNQIKTLVETEYQNLKKEYLSEKNFVLAIETSATNLAPMTKESSKVLIGAYASVFNGV